jgi:regulatory protein
MVGGRAALIVPVEAVRREGVTVGSPLTGEQIDRLVSSADLDAAFRTAVRALERRPFARKDLARRLVLKGHPPALIEEALDRAERLGYLDDERFARHFVQAKSARGRGPRRLRRELAAQGVASPLVERVLAEELGSDWLKRTIQAVAAKRARQLADLPRPDRIRRLMAHLGRRGFSGPEALEVVRQVVDPG